MTGASFCSGHRVYSEYNEYADMATLVSPQDRLPKCDRSIRK